MTREMSYSIYKNPSNNIVNKTCTTSAKFVNTHILVQLNLSKLQTLGTNIFVQKKQVLQITQFKLRLNWIFEVDRILVYSGFALDRVPKYLALLKA